MTENDARILYEVACKLYSMVETIGCAGKDAWDCRETCPYYVSRTECGLTMAFDLLEPIGRRIAER